ncbi:MAG TPA: hypothetical protein PKH24_02555 [Sedimentisphaerales bacterium]|nr:hypothetical protein [Sedimentisphaerales bacterium]HNU28286.1 hypothetical protein [Sedimentisphaerales bacterium]
MHAAELTRAAQRLRHAPWPSAVTQQALKRLTESPSKAALIEDLDRAGSAPVALEILCALELECEQVFQAVRRAVENNAGLCWALVESLNRLPWYGGIRAFLSLEDPPESSPCVYPFYILVRNKLFIPSDMPHKVYAYHHRGLWRLLPVARSENWQAPHHSVLAVVGMMVKHLTMSRPDPFVVYLAGLLVGRVCPVESNLDTLRLRSRSDADSGVRTAAHLAMRCIQTLCPATLSEAPSPSPSHRRESAVNRPCTSAATGATYRP